MFFSKSVKQSLKTARLISIRADGAADHGGRGAEASPAREEQSGRHQVPQQKKGAHRDSNERVRRARRSEQQLPLGDPAARKRKEAPARRAGHALVQLPQDR